MWTEQHLPTWCRISWDWRACGSSSCCLTTYSSRSRSTACSRSLRSFLLKWNFRNALGSISNPHTHAHTVTTNNSLAHLVQLNMPLKKIESQKWDRQKETTETYCSVWQLTPSKYSTALSGLLKLARSARTTCSLSNPMHIISVTMFS